MAPCTSYKTNPINKPEVNSSNNTYDLQKQTPSTNQKATFQPDPRTYKENPINKPENNRSNKAEGYRFYFFWEGTHTHTPSQEEGWVFKKQTPLTDQKTTVQPERRPTKQTPTTDPKTTVQPKPRTYKANPINKTEDNSSNRSNDLKKQTSSTDQKTTVQPRTRPKSKPHQQTRNQQFNQGFKLRNNYSFMTHAFPWKAQGPSTFGSDYWRLKFPRELMHICTWNLKPQNGVFYQLTIQIWTVCSGRAHWRKFSTQRPSSNMPK